jgi:hypothetical protein
MQQSIAESVLRAGAQGVIVGGTSVAVNKLVLGNSQPLLPTCLAAGGIITGTVLAFCTPVQK